MCYITKNSFTVADISKQTSAEHEIWQVGTEGGKDKKWTRGLKRKIVSPWGEERSRHRMFKYVSGLVVAWVHRHWPAQLLEARADGLQYIFKWVCVCSVPFIIIYYLVLADLKAKCHILLISHPNGKNTWAR